VFFFFFVACNVAQVMNLVEIGLLNKEYREALEHKTEGGTGIRD